MRKLLFALFLISLSQIKAQAPEKWSSSEIYQHIKELNFLGSVLYIAAHPDDENTRLISYFSNEVNARTAYLSITRGDGGQNLIGPEIREQLGIIRTQELLSARRIDGGQQFFTRANDFGYSKTPSETLEIWDKEQVLADVVWIIRSFKPDIIINRFDHRTPGSTHGHHTSSAILSVEAFEMAGDKNAYKNQLELVDAFQPQRLFFNTSSWFYGGREAFEKADKSNLISFDTGVYFPLKGLSNPEIAALSRSRHQSQGFGSSGSRGSQIEYVELLKGNLPADSTSIFQGIDTNWKRVKGGDAIAKILNEVEKDYDFQNPSKSIPNLLNAYSLIENLEEEHWREIKSKEIKDIIYACSGLYLEAVAENSYATPGEEVPVQLEAIHRSDQELKLNHVELSPNNSRISPSTILKNNEDWNDKILLKIPQNMDYTSPYWLNEKGTEGMYKVKDQNLIGQPQNPIGMMAKFQLDFSGTLLEFEKPIVYKYTDDVNGETYVNFDIVPPVSIDFPDDVLIFNTENPKTISVSLVAQKPNLKGRLELKSSRGWKIEPENSSFSISQKGGTALLSFKITPPNEQAEIYLNPKVSIDNQTYSSKINRINYGHISNQSLVVPAVLKLVKLNVKKKGERIAYIEGAGDIVPESLEQIGYTVIKIKPESISAAYLKNFDAVVLGVRAYNTVEGLKFKQNILFEYVQAGGNLIVQYNTGHALLTENIAPYNLSISRDRVTEEDATVSFLTPQHPVLNTPNKITEKDFESWVQERGLYFPNSWDENFTPILSMHDQNESAKNGSLLVAEYGKGYFIYTGLSFFRQFPAGVPGAYRLFANLISIGK